MTTATFDAFMLVQSLRKKGTFTPEQAEELATAFSAAMKSDIATSSDIELAKTDLQKTIAETKSEILKWSFGAVGFQTLVIVGVVLSLAHH